jgi:hypothetical protein
VTGQFPHKNFGFPPEEASDAMIGTAQLAGNHAVFAGSRLPPIETGGKRGRATAGMRFSKKAKSWPKAAKYHIGNYGMRLQICMD